MAAHAATCDDCAARLAKLKKTRSLVLSVAIEAVPTDFESRIMAAVDAGLAKRASLAVVEPMRAAAKPERGAKVVSLFSRPSFAMAATFVLVIGAGALILARTGASMKSVASSDEAPMAAASAFTPVPMPAETAPAAAEATATAAPPAAVAAATATPQQAGALALNDDGKSDSNAVGTLGRAAKPSAPGAPPPAAAAPVKLAAKAGPSGADSAAFAAAESRYNAGRYAAALPRFEARSARNPQAELYAARCIARTQGCKAAEARYDTAAQTNAGTEAGSRAQLEGARCYQSTGDVVAARRRYSAAKDEGLLENEAQKALQELDQTGGGAGAAGGAHAAPKSAAPAPRPAQVNETK
jgi:hypothetical protein